MMSSSMTKYFEGPAQTNKDHAIYWLIGVWTKINKNILIKCAFCTTSVNEEHIFMLHWLIPNSSNLFTWGDSIIMQLNDAYSTDQVIQFYKVFGFVLFLFLVCCVLCLDNS